MDVYKSWYCECATREIAYSKCKLSVDFMSGCFYLDDKMMQYIKSTKIQENKEEKCFEFLSTTNQNIYYIRFYDEKDYKEVVELQEKYNQLFPDSSESEKTYNNKDYEEAEWEEAKGAYRLKSSRLPGFNSFVIYRTTRYMYVVARCLERKDVKYRILKIELASDNKYEGCLEDIIFDDGREYDLQSVNTLLRTIRDGNKSGLTHVCTAKALLGFVRFTRYYYLAVATEVKEEGAIMGHIIYSIANYDVIPLCSEVSQKGFLSSFLPTMSNLDEIEEKNLGLFNMVDLSNGFFFSYNYSLSYSSQYNILQKSRDCPDGEQSMFVWNNYLLSEFRTLVSSQWYVSLIQGVFLQKHCIQNGFHFQLSLIARRSREYAGPRYLKRGINDDGYVANEVEVETLIEDDNGHICSHVQLRGSIPGYWKQDVSVAVPRPPIQITKNDLLFRSFIQHLSLLFERYSAPIQVIDLVKTKEKHPRESLVYQLLYDSCEFVNNQMPDGMKINYVHVDFADYAKRSSVKDPILHNILLNHSKLSLDDTSFFATYIAPNTIRRVKEVGQGVPLSSIQEHEECVSLLKDISEAFKKDLLNNLHLEQHGVMRSNCIDCLDRTNVAQFFLSYTVVYRMLFTLGIELSPEVPESSPLQRLLIDMYKELGDIISIHYGGSNAHDKIETTRGNSKKRKEIFTTILRHYNNTFNDKVKQESYNVFLGVYRPHDHLQVMNETIAKGGNDYYLHNRGFLNNSVSIVSKEKWWLSPLYHYELNFKGTIEDFFGSRKWNHPAVKVWCSHCKFVPVFKECLLCPQCGSLLQRSLPRLPMSSFYVYTSDEGDLLVKKEENDFSSHFSKPYLHPNITTSKMDQQSNEDDHPKMWVDWNRRTFAVTNKKVSKDKENKKQAIDDDDEDYDNQDLAVPSSSHVSCTPTDLLDEGQNDIELSNTMHSSINRFAVNTQEAIWNIQNRSSEFCVFPSYQKNMTYQEFKLYDSYASYRNGDNLTLRRIQNLPCEEKNVYQEYIESCRLEDNIDLVSCSIQQQEMNAVYHVKYEEEEYERDENCCILINDVITEEDIASYKKYAE